MGLIEALRGRKRWCFIADDHFHARLAQLLPAEERHRLLRLSEISSLTPSHLDGFEATVICSNGSEDLPRDAVAKRLGLRPLRLFADLALRQAAGAPLRAPMRPAHAASPPA